MKQHRASSLPQQPTNLGPKVVRIAKDLPQVDLEQAGLPEAVVDLVDWAPEARAAETTTLKQCPRGKTDLLILSNMVWRL